MLKTLLALCALFLAPALASAAKDLGPTITTTDGMTYVRVNGEYYPSGSLPASAVPKQMPKGVACPNCTDCADGCPCAGEGLYCRDGRCSAIPARVPAYLPQPTMPQTPKRVLYYQQKCENGRCTLVPVYAP